MGDAGADGSEAGAEGEAGIGDLLRVGWTENGHGKAQACSRPSGHAIGATDTPCSAPDRSGAGAARDAAHGATHGATHGVTHGVTHDAAHGAVHSKKAWKPSNGSKRRFLKTRRDGPGSARCVTGWRSSPG